MPMLYNNVSSLEGLRHTSIRFGDSDLEITNTEAAEPEVNIDGNPSAFEQEYDEEGHVFSMHEYTAKSMA